MTRKINSSNGRDINSSNKRDTDDLKKTIATLLDDAGCTEAEAKSRQAKAAKMLHSLGLTEDEVRAKDPDMFQSETVITRFDWIVTQFVMSPIEELTGTQGWYKVLPTPTGKRSDRKVVFFAGYRSDVDQATWLFSHVLAEATKGARGISVTAERNSYLVGFASAVNAKLHALRQSLDTVREQAKSTSGMELVLIEKARIVQDFLNTIAPGLSTDSSKGTSVKNNAAAQAGVHDGQNVSLGRGVSQGAKALAHT